MAFKPGTQGDFINSMAQAMEDAFFSEWNKAKGIPLPAEVGQEDRMILFAAIAQGVVQHFKDEAGDSFVVDVDVEQDTNGDNPLMASKNKGEINFTCNTTNCTIPIDGAEVEQVEDQDNRIISKGTTNKVQIVTYPDSSSDFI